MVITKRTFPHQSPVAARRNGCADDLLLISLPQEENQLHDVTWFPSIYLTPDDMCALTNSREWDRSKRRDRTALIKNQLAFNLRLFSEQTIIKGKAEKGERVG